MGSLGQESRVRPTHGKGGATWENQNVAKLCLKPEIGRPDGGEGEILPHPAGEAEPVVEIVEVALPHEKFFPLGDFQPTQELGRGQRDMGRGNEGSVGWPTIEEEPEKTVRLGRPEEAVDNFWLRGEGDHRQRVQTSDDIHIIGRGTDHHRGTSRQLLGRGSEERGVLHGVASGQRRGEDVEKVARACLGGQGNCRSD